MLLQKDGNCLQGNNVCDVTPYNYSGGSLHDVHRVLSVRVHQGAGVHVSPRKHRHADPGVGDSGLVGTLPTSLSVCTAVFLKSWVADWNTDLILFRLEDKNGIGWARLWMYAGEKTTTMTAYIGQDKEEVKVAPTESLPMFFPQSWMRVCMSLDMDNGTRGGRLTSLDASFARCFAF